MGAALASSWNDVSIIDENDIWVVGYIEIDEHDTSTGLDYSRYNAAHWDGEEWTLNKIIVLRVLFPDQGEGIHYDSSGQEIKSVFRINNDLILMTLGGQHAYFTNEEWIYYEDQYWSFYYSVNCMWGTSLSNMYLPGDFGRIVYYNGSSYEFYQVSDREIRFIDIWGLDDSHIWVAGYDHQHGDSQILFFDGSTWYEKYYLNHSDWWPDNVDPDTLNGPIRTIWAYGDTVYYGTLYGVWKESISTHRGSMVSLTDMGIADDTFWPVKIRGNGYNDIFIVGEQGRTVHYNGASWKVIMDRTSDYIIHFVDIIENLVVIVGLDVNVRALTIRGFR
jgi:hypothetical protein